MDNANQGAPLIPAGTAPTVLGTTTFPNQGQAPSAPESDQVSRQGLEQALQQVLGETPTSVDTKPQGTPPAGQVTFDELAKKKGFKSADDLAAAYQNLESDHTKARMDLADLVRARQDSQPLDEAPIQEVQTQEDAMKVVQRVVSKMTKPLEDRIELTNLFIRNADALNYAPGMAKAVRDNPGIRWEAAYKLAKFEELETQSKEKGRQEAYQAIEQKQAAVAGGGAPASRTQPVSLAQLQAMIQDRSIPFGEVQKIVKEALRP